MGVRQLTARLGQPLPHNTAAATFGQSEETMTNGELIFAATMRIEGSSWAEIGKSLSYDPAHVCKAVQAHIFRCGKSRAVIYPRIKAVIDEEYGGSIARFAAALGCKRQYVYSALVGHTTLSPALVGRMQTLTGLSEQELKEGCHVPL